MKSAVRKSIIIALVLVIAAVTMGVFFVLNKRKEQQPNAVMELNLNPSVQLLLDNDNKVMSVNCLNEDAEILLSDQDLEGKTAEEATKIFIELSFEAGYLNLYSEDNTNPEGKKFEISIYCEIPDEVLELKDKLVQVANDFFDENGVIAGAVANISDNLSEAIEKIGVKVEEVYNLTKDQVLDLYNKTSQELKKLALSVKDELNSFIESAKQNLDFENIKAKLIEIKEQLEDIFLTDEMKEELNKLLEQFQAQFQEVLDVLKQQIQEKIETLKQSSSEIFVVVKEQLEEKINMTQDLIEAHKEYFELHKEAIENAIKAYRETLNTEAA